MQIETKVTAINALKCAILDELESIRSRCESRWTDLDKEFTELAWDVSFINDQLKAIKEIMEV